MVHAELMWENGIIVNDDSDGQILIDEHEARELIKQLESILDRV